MRFAFHLQGQGMENLPISPARQPILFCNKKQNARYDTDVLFFGAGDGNRTHVTSLEGWGSTIELHPPKDGLDIRLEHPKWSGRRDSDSRHPPWQGGTLPLSYYRMPHILKGKMVRAKGLEPIRHMAPDPKSGASAIPPRPQGTHQSLHKERNGDPSEARTPDTLIKSQVLCQLS